MRNTQIEFLNLELQNKQYVPGIIQNKTGSVNMTGTDETCPTEEKIVYTTGRVAKLLF